VQAADARFLVLAPTGRDASLTCDLLERAGMASVACPSISALCSHWDEQGALGLLLAEEALTRTARGMLGARLARQEPWSDLPILLFRCGSTELAGSPLSPRMLAELGNVTLLERPLQQITMLSAADAALRARRRQFAARDALHAEQQAVRQRDQFLAMLGHELRNPLAAISLAAQSESEGVGALHVVRRQVRHLTRLVDDLLDVSRVTSGKIVLQRSELELGRLVAGAVDTLRSGLSARRLTLTLQRASEPIFVSADAVRLEQVVTNLVGNAAKYTGDGGHVSVSVSASESEAVLTVRDDGVGISPDMLPRIFDLFAQAEGSLDRSQGGMGIGLTLVRSLLRLHGGRIDAHSDGLGRGSTFTAHVPRLHAAPPGDVPSAPAASAVSEVVPSRRVLVVEDNDDSRELLSAFLVRRGHQVSTAADGLDGIVVATRDRPEVILVDIGLPGLDGYQVAERLRRELGGTPYLVALTGYGQPEDRARARAAGFDQHLTKPVDMAVLQRLIGSRERTA
jgi:signal transduction histidine kinase/ActR/RegA family two-component response regulator